MNNFNYNNLTPFKWFVLENFPFIENDFEAINNYRLFSKVVEYLNKTIDDMNAVGQQTEDITNAMANLQNYVNNYFDNLDVQDEINNKLDEMVEDGTLEDIINQQIFGELNTRVENTENNIILINENIEDIKLEKKGMWGISRNVIDNIHHLIYSDDGIHWNYVGNAIDVSMADPSAVCEINGVFYYIGDGYYRYSTDLQNWSEKQTFLTNPTYSRVWASSFFFDKLMNKIYAYSSFQYSNETITTPSGGTSYKFKIVVQEGVQNEDGTITFGNAQDLYFDSSKSYIDPYVIYDSVWGYLIAIKDEVASTVSIYNMTNPLSVTTLKTTIKGIGIEAPQLITDGQGNIFCYIHNYNLYPQAISGVTTLQNTQGVVRLSTKETFVSSANALQSEIFGPLSFRHMGVAMCSDKVYYLLKQIGISCVPSIDHRYVNVVGKKELREITTDGTYTVVNHPNIIYQIGDNTPSHKATVTLNLKTVFNNEPFKFLLNNCEITWGGDINSWISNYNKTLINNDSIFNYVELPLLMSGITRPKLTL